LTCGDHRRQIELGRAVAVRAVGVELVLVLEKACDGVEIELGKSWRVDRLENRTGITRSDYRKVLTVRARVPSAYVHLAPVTGLVPSARHQEGRTAGRRITNVTEEGETWQ
jgi:hypothetical protein